MVAKSFNRVISFDAWFKKFPNVLLVFITIVVVVTSSCSNEVATLGNVDTGTVAVVDELPKITSTEFETKTATSTVTPTKEPTQTPLPTQTSTPTATSLPARNISYVDFRMLYYLGLEPLLSGMYHFNDGYDLFDGYPGYPYPDKLDYSSYNQRLEAFLKEVYEQESDAEFYCRYIYAGNSQNYGYIPFGDARMFYWDALRTSIGHICYQFDVEYDRHRAYNSGEFPRPTPLPQTDLGWGDEERQYVVDTYLQPMTKLFYDKKNGISYVPYFVNGVSIHYPFDGSWSRQELVELPDVVIAWMVVNHSPWALELWCEAPYESTKSEYECRVDSRLMLSEDFRVKGLHPDLLTLIGPQFYPDHLYND